jgi:hypothetical protein
MDNATTNDVLFKTAIWTLLTLYDIPEHPDKQIRCLAHVINLVSQAILGALKEVDKCIEVGDELDHFLLHKDNPIHYKIGDNIELQELEASREKDLSNDDNMGEMGSDAFERQLDAQEVESMTGRSSLQRVR